MIAFLTSPLGKFVAVGLVLLAIFGGFKIWLGAHDQALLEGYVLKSEKIAAEAERDEIKRQLAGGQLAIESYQVILKNLRSKEADEDAIAVQKEKSYEETIKSLGNKCGLSDFDLEFLGVR